jgi:glucokinase
VDGTPAHAIGIDLGGTKILAGVVTRDGEILRRHERPTPTSSQEDLLAEIDAAVEELMDDGIAAIGLGVPGPIDQVRGRVIFATNLPLADIGLRDRMREKFGVAVGFDNDANAAAIGEWQAGAGRGETNVLMITLGTGVGGGVIVDGVPFRGGEGAGAELGHVTVVADGEPCHGACKGRGHLEAYITGVAATKRAREAFGPAADAHRLVRLANEGDEVAKDVLGRIGVYLGYGLASHANVFNPKTIVIGGGFGVAALEHLLPETERIFRRDCLVPAATDASIVKVELGTAAGLIGAAFVGYEALDAA